MRWGEDWASAQQITDMRRAFGRAGLRNQDDKLDWTGRLLGRRVDDLDELTATEADAVLAQLEAPRLP